MGKSKTILTRIALMIVIIAVIAGSIWGYYYFRDWTKRYRSELDTFFGKDNWEFLSEESLDSHILKEPRIRNNDTPPVEPGPAKYQNWYIKHNNKSGEQEVWKITNHVYKLNKNKYFFLNQKRLSAKQALIMELMEISFQVAGDEVRDNILNNILSEEEANVFNVLISYSGGNPPPKVYNQLWQQDWFNVNEVSAENYLSTDIWDFYIEIKAYDYRIDQLTEAQQQHIIDSMETMEKKLLEKYGDYASFKIMIDQNHQVEYVNGQKK